MRGDKNLSDSYIKKEIVRNIQSEGRKAVSYKRKCVCFMQSPNKFILTMDSCSICICQGSVEIVRTIHSLLLPQILWYVLPSSILSNFDILFHIALSHVATMLEVHAKLNYRSGIVFTPIKLPFQLSVLRLAVRNSQLLSSYCTFDIRFRYLSYAIRSWATAKAIAGRGAFQLTKYAWAIMLLHYLQHCDPPVLPCLQKEKASITDHCFIEGWDCYFDAEPEKSAERQNSLSLGKL